jgi:hypothetical protein
MNDSERTSAVSSSVIESPKVSPRIAVFGARHNWRNAVIERLTELARLEQGWDGYRGKPVSLENAAFALRMFEAICGPNAAKPQLVPGPSGDLQIEWHTMSGDIELHVLALNRVEAWRKLVGRDDDGASLGLTEEFGAVAAWVREN